MVKDLLYKKYFDKSNNSRAIVDLKLTGQTFRQLWTTFNMKTATLLDCS